MQGAHNSARSSSADKRPSTVATSFIFTIDDHVGRLAAVLSAASTANVSFTRLESRPSTYSVTDAQSSASSLSSGAGMLGPRTSSKSGSGENFYDFFADVAVDQSSEAFARLLDVMKPLTRKITVLSSEQVAADAADRHSAATTTTPWFPRKIADLDKFTHKTLDCGEELDSDHPGFSDAQYRKRRNEICAISRTYAHGDRIPRIDYTDTERATWGTVYRKLTSMYPTHACRQLNYIFPLLEANCGYGPDNIPQLEDISRFLKDVTGWSLRPVTGLLSPRDFLNGLAFRVFHSTQYIRHESKPFYTPEPDVCHELLGHVPLFADPAFADFSQEIGLMSLGASDDDITKLATCYWFTVEFGLCREDGALKAYGAGLLSSFGELEYCLSSKPELRPFDPPKTAHTDYPITEYQPVYYVAESFEDAKKKLTEWTQRLDRPFGIYYNPYTQSVQVVDNKESLQQLVGMLSSQVHTLATCIANAKIVS